MKLSVFIAAMLLFSCTDNSPRPPFPKKSKEYSYIKELSYSAPLLGLDDPVELIRTTQFSVRSFDIMPDIYNSLSQLDIEPDKISKERIAANIRQAARKLAVDKLLLLSAIEHNIVVPEDTVKKALNELYDANMGKQVYLAWLKKKGIKLTTIKNKVVDSLSVYHYLDQIVFKECRASYGEIRAVYNQDHFATVRHILMLPQNGSDSEKERIKKTMQELLERIRNGADFASLARQYSQDQGTKKKGGLLLDCPRGRMTKEFEDAAFSLPYGGVSDIIETEYGFHIIKVINRRKNLASFNDVQEDIRRDIVNGKKSKAYFEHLAKLKDECEYEELVTL